MQENGGNPGSAVFEGQREENPNPGAWGPDKETSKTTRQGDRATLWDLGCKQ